MQVTMILWDTRQVTMILWETRQVTMILWDTRQVIDCPNLNKDDQVKVSLKKIECLHPHNPKSCFQSYMVQNSNILLH